MPEDKQMKWHRRVQTKLAAGAALAIVLPMLVFYLTSTHISADALLQEAEEDLQAAVEHASSALHNFVNEIATDIRPSPYDPDLTSLAPPDLELYLSFILQREPTIENVSLVTIAGRERSRASRAKLYSAQELRDLAGSEALAAAEKGMTYFGVPFASPNREPMMVIAAPVRDPSHRITGMLMADVSLRKVFAAVEETVEAFLYIYVVDSQGTLIAHPDFSLVLKRVSLKNTRVVSDALSLAPGQTTPVMHHRNVLGREVKGMGGRSKTVGWCVIAEIAAEEALPGVRESRTVCAIIFASAAAIGVAASLYVGTRTGNLIVRIQKAAGAIGEGNFTQRIHVKGGGELEELATDLNLMGDKLKEYHDHMEHDVELLNDQVAERTESLQKAYNDLQESDRQLKETQAALVQTEKLAAMGRLVAGVMHEVNNPLTYITNNVDTLQRDVTALADLIRLYVRTAQAEDTVERARLLREAEALGKTLNVEYTLTNLEGVFSRTSEGLNNIRKIVTDLRDFSRMGGAEREPVDLNKAVETTLSIVAYDLRRKQISVETDLAQLPPVECAPVKINQVLLNIVLNAIQAASEKGSIRITTKSEGEWVTISIRDDGHGIPEEIMPKMFDPFFTTRPPGEGTGLGLSVSYGIIKEHGGTIQATSAPGEGAEFTVRLPVALKREA